MLAFAELISHSTNWILLTGLFCGVGITDSPATC